MLAVAIVFFASSAIAQTSRHRIGITLGGGPQDYKGELGNGFRDNSAYDVWRGAIVVQAAYYINHTFDAGINASFGDFLGLASQMKLRMLR